jgi:6-phosphogluconate dehydrogenase
MTEKRSADIGVIGLAVMGQNLALNMADHAFTVAVYNRTRRVMHDFVAAHAETPGGLIGCDSLAALVQTLKTPRKIVLLVKAGAPVDEVIQQLIAAGIGPDDIIVDCGNSLWTDTIRRERQYLANCRFFGSGVSGGEVGARFGPSLMPGGAADAWKHLQPIWEAIAAKVDAETGRPIDTGKPGRPVERGVPCTAYIGPNGAGHYVKMIHNGIEYIDMQLISEAYLLLRTLLGARSDELSRLFATWNEGVLDSYLIEITADILQQRDPQTPRAPARRARANGPASMRLTWVYRPMPLRQQCLRVFSAP